jgi:hypothetical protein
MLFHFQESTIKFINTQSVLKLSLFVVFFTLFFAFPPYSSPIDNSTWDAVFMQIKHPFQTIDAPAYSHTSKLTFRLFPVLLGYVFGLSKNGFIVFLHAIGFCIIYLSMIYFNKILKDKFKSLLLSFSLGCIYFGKVSFVEFRGIFDGIALLLLIIPLLYRNYVLTFCTILCASWTDERALIASSLIFISFLFEFFYSNIEKKKIKYQLIAILISWITYFILRFFIANVFHLKTSTGGISLEILALNFEYFPLSFWGAFEGFWFLILFYLFTIWKTNKLLSIGMYLSIFLLIIASYLVIDVTRSLAFLGVLIFIATKFLSVYKKEIFSYRYCQIIFLTSFLYPAYIVAGDQIVWIKPVVLEYIFRLFTNA